MQNSIENRSGHRMSPETTCGGRFDCGSGEIGDIGTEEIINHENTRINTNPSHEKLVLIRVVRM